MGDKGYIGLEVPEEWKLLRTESALNELYSPSDQTAVSTLESISRGRTVIRDTPTTTTAITNTEVAKPRSIVEVSFGKVERYRKLTSGHIRISDDENLIQMLVYIAVFVTNLTIKKILSL